MVREFQPMWLKVATVSLALTVAACGPPKVTLERLVAEQDDLTGRRITVTGNVVRFEEPDGTVAFVLEDDHQNRVLLLPAGAVDGHAGEQVVVTGEFEFNPEVGRLLRVDEVRIVRSNATSQPSAKGPKRGLFGSSRSHAEARIRRGVGHSFDAEASGGGVIG